VSFTTEVACPAPEDLAATDITSFRPALLGQAMPTATSFAIGRLLLRIKLSSKILKVMLVLGHALTATTTDLIGNNISTLALAIIPPIVEMAV
jgi:hypothetical protein